MIEAFTSALWELRSQQRGPDEDDSASIPAGITKYRIASVLVINDGTTASLTTAQFGVFTAGGGGGAALLASGMRA